MNGQENSGEDTRVAPYVTFADFFRQVRDLGEEFVYGWDNANNAAGETPA